MKDYGTVRPGSTLYFYAASYAASTGASSAMTGLATSDIKVYKNGSTTERASASGYTLIDTDGLDVDAITGLNGFSIDLADNTTAGFWTAGSDYTVVVSTVTVDSQTVTYIAGTFRIGYPDAILNTTIATLASQTSFTLTAGPAEDDALNGCVLCIHDVASAVQLGFEVVLDYTGSTKTVTLTSGVTFTAAAGDNISVFRPSNSQWIGRIIQPGTDLSEVATNAESASSASVAALALLDDPRSEPAQGAPPVNPDMATKVDYLYKAWRNKKTQTSSQYSLFADDASTVDHKATVSDDGTTTTIGEVASGP